MINGTVIYRAGTNKMKYAAAMARQARMADDLALAAVRRQHQIPVLLQHNIRSAEERLEMAKGEMRRLEKLHDVHMIAARRVGKITTNVDAVERNIAQQHDVIAAAEENLAAAQKALEDHHAANAPASAQEVAEEPEVATEPALDGALTPRRGRPKKTVTP